MKMITIIIACCQPQMLYKYTKVRELEHYTVLITSFQLLYFLDSQGPVKPYEKGFYNCDFSQRSMKHKLKKTNMFMFILNKLMCGKYMANRIP